MSKKLKPTHDFPHNQEISFDNKTKLFLENVVKIKQQNMISITCEEPKGQIEYMINPDRVLFTRFTKEIK